ncbi:MAG: endonuclease/exonuclease/phosphatase family protein [Pseudomonadales bacterium]|nr:endonuclease/exonuclease/phosphatase family protein [Pseudomonadales bacterium]
MRQHWRNFHAVRQAYPATENLLHHHEQAATALLPQEFSLLSWNIYKKLKGKVIEKDLARLLSSTSLACLQEVITTNAAQLSREYAGLNFHYGITYARADKRYEGVLTASRYALKQPIAVIRSLGKELVTQTPKLSLVSLMEMQGGQPLLLINTHMLLFKSARSLRREVKHVLVDCADYQQLPAIYCGDFNTFTRWQLRCLDNILRKHGFTRISNKLYRPNELALDHIYLRGLKVKQISRLAKVKSSDHKPIVCQLALK